MTAQDLMNELRKRVENDYQIQMALIVLLDGELKRISNAIDKTSSLVARAGSTDSPQPHTIENKIGRFTLRTSDEAIQCGLTLPTPFSLWDVRLICGKYVRAQPILDDWVRSGWVRTSGDSQFRFERTEMFGHLNSSAVASAPVEAEKVDDPVVTLKEPIVPPGTLLDKLPAWTCQKCQQVNSGWADKCGRCETYRHGVPVRNPQVDAINGIPEMKEVSNLNAYSNLAAFSGLSMTDKIRKIIMGLGPNVELRRHDLIQALKANVTPWTTKLDGEVTTSLTWLLVQGELKKIGRGPMSVYRIADMKPVASSGELVGKISTKEEEWKKLRETITVPRDVLEDVGEDK